MAQINRGSGSGSDIFVKVTAADTTASYLDSKLVVSTDFTKTVLNPGGNEQLLLGKYSALLITSFTNDVNVVEKGVTVNDVNLAWSYNNPSAVTAQTITDIGAIPLGIYTWALHTLGLTVDKTWILSATDGISNPTANTTVYFRNKRYWTASANAGPLGDADILAMSNEFATSRLTTKIFDCTGGLYIWFCWPTSWGQGTFWISGLQSTFIEFTVSFTNASGHTENYYAYRSEYEQHGSDIAVNVQ